MIDVEIVRNGISAATACKCDKCGFESTAFMQTIDHIATWGKTEGTFAPTKTYSKLLCDVCWNKLYDRCSLTRKVHLRRSMIETPWGPAHQSAVQEYTCPFSGRKFNGPKNIRRLTDHLCASPDADTLARLLAQGHPIDTALYDFSTPSTIEISGLRDEAGKPMLEYFRVGRAIQTVKWVSESGEKWVFHEESQHHMSRLSDCLALDDGYWVHKSTASHYERHCPVTGVVFYTRGIKRISDEGRRIMRNTDLVLCDDGCTVVRMSDSMPTYDGVTSPKSGDFLVSYYSGSKYEIGDKLGRTLGFELELEVIPEAQMRVFKIPSGDNPEVLQRTDSLGKRVRYNAPPVSAVQDGSLRGDHPIEYVSPILYESNYSQWVGDMCEALRGSRVYNRAGFHLHIGTKDMSWCDIVKIGAHAQMYQALYYSMVSPSRFGNTFVKPLPDFIWAMPMIKSKAHYLAWMYGRPVLGADNARHKRANDMGNTAFRNGVVHRYQWINFHSHVYRRTLEIRLHHATCNATKIRNWARLWLSILNHISSGGKWSEHPFKIVSSDLSVYYQHRINRFNEMRSARGIHIDFEPARRGYASDGLTINAAASGALS